MLGKYLSNSGASLNFSFLDKDISVYKKSEIASSRDELANAMESLLTIYDDGDVDSEDEVIIHGFRLMTKPDSQDYEGEDEEVSLPSLTISNEVEFVESKDESSIASEVFDDISYFFSIFDQEDHSTIPDATSQSYSIISDELSTKAEDWDIASDDESSDWDVICPDIQSVFSFDDFNFPFRKQMIKPLHPSSLMKNINGTQCGNLVHNHVTDENELVYLVPDIGSGNGGLRRCCIERLLSPMNHNRGRNSF